MGLNLRGASRHIQRNWPGYAFLPPAAVATAGQVATVFDPERQAAMRHAAAQGATSALMEEFRPDDRAFKDIIASGVSNTLGGVKDAAQNSAKNTLNEVGQWVKEHKGQTAGIAALTLGVPLALNNGLYWATGQDERARRLRRARQRLEAVKAEREARDLAKVAGFQLGRLGRLSKLQNFNMKLPWLATAAIAAPAAAATGINAYRAAKSDGTVANLMMKSPASVGEEISKRTSEAITSPSTQAAIDEATSGAVSDVLAYPFNHPMPFLGGIAASALAGVGSKKLYDYFAGSREHAERTEALKALLAEQKEDDERQQKTAGFRSGLAATRGAVGTGLKYGLPASGLGFLSWQALDPEGASRFAGRAAGTVGAKVFNTSQDLHHAAGGPQPLRANVKETVLGLEDGAHSQGYMAARDVIKPKLDTALKSLIDNRWAYAGIGAGALSIPVLVSAMLAGGGRGETATSAIEDALDARSAEVEKHAAAKSLEDISDATATKRDESFIKPEAMDAPVRKIEDNETAIDANATDKAEPAKEVLKDAVKDTLPSTSPSGKPPHGNLKDEEIENSVAEEVTAPVADEKPAEPVAELNSALEVAAAPTKDEAGEALTKELERVQAQVAAVKSAPLRSVIDDLKAKIEKIIEIRPKIDAVSDLIDQLAKTVPAPAAAEKVVGGEGDGKPDAAFEAKALAEGADEEKEHTDDPAVAKEIAKDHLTEDKDYYEKLEKIEKTAMSRGAIVKFYLDRAKLRKTAEIDVLTGAPGAGKTTAARRNSANYDVVLHGDLPMKLTRLQRRAAVIKRIREAMRSHNMGKRVLLDSAPRQLKRDYQPLLDAAKRVIVMDVPDDVAAAGFAKRTKSSPEKSRRVVDSARMTISDLRNDPRFKAVDRTSVHDMLKKVAAAEKPMRRRAEVLIVDGLNVYCVEKPYSCGGVWFPGGGVDTSDEKFADAAAREAKEETGIVVDEIHRMAEVDPVDCIWSEGCHDDNPKWAEKAKKWRGDRTYFYVATVKGEGKPTGDDPLKGTWLPLKYVASRLLASVPFDNKGWKPLTKARYRAVLDAMPSVRAAPRAA